MSEEKSERILSLIERIKKKDEIAFKDFFYELQPAIFRFIFRLTLDYHASEDLTQETFIKFWEYKDRIDITLSPKSYLYKIAKNIAINFISRKPPLTPIEENENALDVLSKNTNTNYDSIFLNDEYQRAIDTLPKRCRMVFILSRFSGLDYLEIASALDISLQTVKNQMNKALSVLRKKLASHLK